MQLWCTNHRWRNRGGPSLPPTFFAGGAWPPHFSVENKGIIKKILINAAAWLGPPTSNYVPPSMVVATSLPNKLKFIAWYKLTQNATTT